mmetsp:Transcript_22112/g.45083  ORF Transcript_22112/g.45083 Transcript_22112/m.45083 type:complete len:158 (-) Transcript_22112:366-839(-)
MMEFSTGCSDSMRLRSRWYFAPYTASSASSPAEQPLEQLLENRPASKRAKTPHQNSASKLRIRRTLEFSSHTAVAPKLRAGTRLLLPVGTLDADLVDRSDGIDGARKSNQEVILQERLHASGVHVGWEEAPVPFHIFHLSSSSIGNQKCDDPFLRKQ